MINIAVVDDEPIFTDILIDKIANCCNSLGIKYLVDKYSNGYTVLENHKKYHLIFLDIFPVIHTVESYTESLILL